MVFEREQAEKHCSYPSPRVCPNGTQLKKTKVTKQCFKITLHIRIIRFLLKEKVTGEASNVWYIALA